MGYTKIYDGIWNSSLSKNQVIVLSRLIRWSEYKKSLVFQVSNQKLAEDCKTDRKRIEEIKNSLRDKGLISWRVIPASNTGSITEYTLNAGAINKMAGEDIIPIEEKTKLRNAPVPVVSPRPNNGLTALEKIQLNSEIRKKRLNS